jgi:DNA-directed RNA polymerase subunit RPC12/RpoP
MEKPATMTSRERTGEVHCLICSHRVPAQVVVDRRSARVKMGEKCVRCGSSLESGYVLALKPAA